jgi:hypothetical protein
VNARRIATEVLLATTCVLLVAATFGAYAWRVLFDSDRFAERATAALQDPSVRDQIAERVTDELVRGKPNLLAVRPAVVSAVSGVAGGDAFASLFRGGARDVHSALFRRDQDTVTLTVVDIGIVVAEALRLLRPELASELEPNPPVALLERDLGGLAGDLTRTARDIRVLAFIVALLAIAAAAAAVAIARERRHAASRLGLAVAVAGVAVVVVQAVARAIVLDGVSAPDERAAAAAVWDAYLGDLRTTGWLIAGAGALLAAAAASLIRPIEVEAPLRAIWRVVGTEPTAVGWRLARGAALIVAGALVIAAPSAALEILMTVVGLYAIYKGLESILRLINGPEPRERPRVPLRRILVPVAALLLMGAATAAYATGGGIDEPAPAIPGCNGHAELCDRRLDEVALPATHNSMSAPLPGWFASLQDRPIEGQLEDGIRGLLFDTHYADLLQNGRTRTYFGGEHVQERVSEQDGVSPSSVEAALRLRERIGFRGSGERGAYLCHAFCELGSTPLPDVLEDIHEFLVTHPADVVVIVNQDYLTPADFVAAVDDAGLADYALEPPRGSAAWPTLREMVERNQRLVVLAENSAGAAPWYQPAYERLVQETPFTFARTTELTDPSNREATCRPNRGPDSASLLLLNHWINTDPLPRPGNAAVVNAYEPLLRRARACERLRGQRVNLLAVDFYARGDLFEVVDALNGVG